MKIKLDAKHYLNSDAYCYWITCEYEIKEGSRKGQTAERRVSGYQQTFSRAVDTFIEKKIMSADIKEFKALVDLIDEIEAEVYSWKVAVERS